MITQRLFDLWGGQAEVCAPSASIDTAVEAAWQVIEAVDRACSGYRADSDLMRVNDAAGQWVDVDEEFVSILRASLDMAEATGGSTDPTVGYAPAGPLSVRSAEYRKVEVMDDRVRIPAHIRLDLDACAKAWCADAAACAASEATGQGVLVGLLGDISVAGPAPAEGWDVVCSDDHRPSGGPVLPAASVNLRGGGMATSSILTRRRADRSHIVDPVSLAPVEHPWRTVSVAADSCLHANAASTAAIVRGASAPRWLEGQGLPARLVHLDGTVVLTEGWPS